MAKTKKEPMLRNYYVDEAGDANLFARKGRVIIGTEGTSHFFILGLLDIENPDTLGLEMETLRAKLLADPYFKNVPSMRPEQKKTAVAFHAKDDLPEVRREVFELLRKTEGLHFFAVVADKMRVLEYVRQRNEREADYRYDPNELYDYLVRRLFKDRLHKDSGYDIYFSKRGRSNRTAALLSALQMARQNFFEKWGITSDAPINVVAGTPPQYPGLQAVDYFLWALQRLYESNEDRFIELLWDSFSLVHDIDDNRIAGYGVYYTQKKPLNKAALQGRT
jgi:hypothetical protein